MSKRQAAISEENTVSEVDLGEEEVQDAPPETRRTRSGRKVRTPAALLDSQAPLRTPSRRTRRSVLQELPAAEEKNTEESVHNLETLTEEKLGMSAAPEPDTLSQPAEPHTDAAADTDRAEVNGSVDSCLSKPAPAETAPKSSETVPKKKPRLGSSGKQTPVIPLGKPASGRVWKDRNKQRFSALLRDKPLCSSWEKKMEVKREKDQMKKYTLQLKEDKTKQKEEKRKRREDNLKRRAENERKSEIVQVIRNTAKIKRMKKKQLRKIEKRDTLALLQKSTKQSVKAKRQKSQKVDQVLT
ncbi:LOW QUALITY PROTEIN: coiled-coil domain-containing protein 86 [Cottoperca gobio]|uniref:Coiled-coil domain-containing protein 86 n=1 Tax=Cottoperca gobio TaxID=56716 RepID=A0A6J2QGQ7_COTGO|nr:LOW QUALITY PROTEIN: coiled-coil domain-containing protein 86 [Cottoperca gobio]